MKLLTFIIMIVLLFIFICEQLRAFLIVVMFMYKYNALAITNNNVITISGEPLYVHTIQ